ncbi:hypothetical protein [Metallibacterium scheffleri]|nr:hypothetical protein [Xanthomonadaceae bacterium]
MSFFEPSTVISLAAIVVMLVCLTQVLRLSKSVPGGIVGRTWKQLTGLVVLFTIGYLLTPFFPLLPQAIVNPLVSLIFLFGAVYVLITVRLIHRVISELAG